MAFGQLTEYNKGDKLTEYNKGDIFLQKSCRNEAGRLVKKAFYKVKVSGLQIGFTIFR